MHVVFILKAFNMWSSANNLTYADNLSRGSADDVKSFVAGKSKQVLWAKQLPAKDAPGLSRTWHAVFHNGGVNQLKTERLPVGLSGISWGRRIRMWVPCIWYWWRHLHPRSSQIFPTFLEWDRRCWHFSAVSSRCYLQCWLEHKPYIVKTCISTILTLDESLRLVHPMCSQNDLSVGSFSLLHVKASSPTQLVNGFELCVMFFTHITSQINQTNQQHHNNNFQEK